MWIVLKANNKEQEFLRKSLIEKIGKNLKFYTLGLFYFSIIVK